MPESIGGTEVFLQDYAAQAPLVQDSLTPLAVALGLFSLVVGVAGLLVVGQAVTRHTRSTVEDETTLAAMGFSRGQRVALPILRSVPIALAGAAGAAVVAYLLSPRFPIGLARLAEPDRGFDVDPAVFVIGVPAIVVLTLLAVLPAAVRRPRLGDAPDRAPSRAWTARWARLPLVPSEGIRFAFDGGSGATRVPVRSGIVAAAVAVAALLAATTFAASLDGFLADPSRYGQQWSRMVDQQFSPVPVVALLDELEPVDGVRGVAGGVYGETDIDGERVPAIGWQPLRDNVSLTMVEGRMASAADEVALGGEILDRLDLSVGDTVEVDGGEGPTPRRIVGEAVFPRLGLGSFAATGLGVGAQLSPDGLVGTSLPGPEELATFVETPELFSLDGQSFNFLVVDAEDPGAVDDAVQPLIDDGFLLASRIDQRPTRVTDLTRVQEIPNVLALVFAVLAAAVVAHVLISSVRQRRSDLAVLRTLGFQRSQLRGTVAWQASAIAISALVIGIPVGIAAGRFAWDSFVAGLHVPALPATPWASVVLVVPITLLVANPVAAVPAMIAARVRPAEALRRE